MKYDPTTRTIELGRKDCGQCRYQDPQGTVCKRLDCLTCNGTGRGPRGGKGKCRACSGFGNRYDHDVRETCPHCNGEFEGFESENYCDTAPVEALQDMPTRVVFIDRDSTWDEKHLGMGTIWSTTDYGDAWKSAAAAVRLANEDPDSRAESLNAWKNDFVEKIVDKLHTERVQAVKIVRSRDDLTVKDIILIKVTRGGYTVSAFDLTKEN